MFKAVINEKNLKFFKDIISTCSYMCNDVNLNLTDKGIDISTMDDSHISLCKIHIDKEIFNEIVCDKTYVIGITLEQFLCVLKCSLENLTIIYKENADILNLNFITSSFELKLMDLNIDEIIVPDNIEYECSVEYKSSDFYTNINKYKLIGDDLKMTFNNNGVIKYNVKGDRITCEDNPKPINIITNQNNDIVLNSSLNVLIKVIKAHNISDNVQVSISNNYPILICYRKGNTFINYYIAPKMDEDED